MASGYIKANEEKEEADSNRLIGSSILPIEEVSIELVDNTSIHDGKNYGGGGGGGCSSNDDKVKNVMAIGQRIRWSRLWRKTHVIRLSANGRNISIN